MPTPKREVWMPAPYDDADIRALQTLEVYAMGADRPWPAGQEPPTPSPADVRRALNWIIYGAAQYTDNGFMPKDPGGRIGAFIDGRQSVAEQIVKLMKLKLGVITKEKQ